MIAPSLGEIGANGKMGSQGAAEQVESQLQPMGCWLSYSNFEGNYRMEEWVVKKLIYMQYIFTTFCEIYHKVKEQDQSRVKTVEEENPTAQCSVAVSCTGRLANRYC